MLERLYAGMDRRTKLAQIAATTLRVGWLCLIAILAVGAIASYLPLPVGRCPTHGAILWNGPVPVHYGLPSGMREVPSYQRARDEQFPNARDSVGGGCVVPRIRARTARATYCRACLAVRRRWETEHHLDLLRELESIYDRRRSFFLRVKDPRPLGKRLETREGPEAPLELGLLLRPQR